MTILVTGCAGFIGSHVTDALLSAGHRVVGVDNFDPIYPRDIKERNLSGPLKNPGFTFVEADIRSAEVMTNVFSRFTPHVVVHLAAKAGVLPSIAAPREYFDVNVGGTVVLLEAIRATPGCKLVFASSSSVYGNSVVPFSESQPVAAPISPYAASKRAAELVCFTYHHLNGIPVHCLRFFTVYGPRQRPEMAISKFSRSILRGDRIDLYSNGESSRDYTFVGDIVSGVLSSIDRVSGYQILNLGGSTPVTLRQLVSTIEKVTGKTASIRLMPGQPGDVDQTYASIDRAREILDYAPVTSLEQGLTKFVDWFAASDPSPRA
jgi:UDP-glucuronate 4-epimerase